MKRSTTPTSRTICCLRWMLAALVIFSAVLTAAPAPTTAAPQAPAAADLVGYWRFDEGAGATAGDSSDYGNTGAISGATWTAGKVSGALSFDGVDDRVAASASASLSLSTNRVTVAGWVYPTSVSGDFLTFMQRSNAAGSWFDWQIYARASDAPTANRPVFRVDWNQNGVLDADEQVQGDIVLQANTWYFIAATYDGTAMRFYIDGTLRGTTARSGGVIPNGNQAIWIGGNSPWGEYFPGKIDEVQIYNRALTQVEIQALMSTGPTISITGVPLNAFGSTPGVPSAQQSYTVSGSNLTGNVTLTAPADFEISTTSGSGWASSLILTQSGGTVGPTSIYVRFNRATAGVSSGTITHASAGATTQNVAVSGTAAAGGAVTFAAFGDYGSNSANEQAVATMVAGWNPDFIVTTGDNSYGSTAIDTNIGKYYQAYIGNYVGAYGSGSATNRFFPSMGNHDYTDGGGSTAYFNYFTLPNNERYYDFVQGPVHFFVIDSNPAGTGSAPGDGRSPTSAQGTWLQAGLAASTAPWKIVYMHHPPFSSGNVHGSETAMQWPYEAWGATAVLAGHDHTYERIVRDDNGNGTNMPYFVTGAGGMSLYGFVTPVAGSQVRYSANYGSMRIQATSASITFEFWAVVGGLATLIDSYTINTGASQTLPINTGSTWKYLDDGSNQGTAWKESAFDDAAWASGAAELGYGDGGEATVVNCGPNAPTCTSGNYTTTYFRKAFTVPDASLYAGLNLRLLRDDGAVVYLNGAEIWRTNMPAGAVTYSTLAPVAIGGTDETTFVSPPATLPNTLVNGTNVLAVEIHQSGATSTDISFDLELTGVTAPSGLVCESFNSYAPGSRIGSYAGWYDGGASVPGPVVTAGNGVAGSIGLAPAASVFHWTAHPFNWNAADFQSVSLQMDYRTDANGAFDDDRLAWTIASANVESANQFGVQLDSADGGITTYWRNSSDVRVQTPIVALPALAVNTWYRLSAVITRLTATSAKIDVSFVQLDAGGNPTGPVTAGSVPDTSQWAAGAPNVSYFTATSMWPSYKNHNATPGAAPADNTCYQVATGAATPRTLTVNVSPSGGGSVTKNPNKTTYNDGESVQLTAVPAAGYAFSAWSGDLTGSTNPATIVMNADKTVTAIFGPAPTGWAAYNDCVYDPTKALAATDPNGQLVHYKGANVTTFGIGTNFPPSGSGYTSSGILLDRATGTPTGVTASLTQSGGVVWQPDISTTWNGGYDTAAGTDARNTFGGIADMTGVIYYGSSGWWVDLTLTGLDPARTYTFATSSSRANSTYTNRLTRYTLSGADAATNASTAGVTVVDNLTVAFNTGDNHSQGYVARWTGIQPGADGSIKVRAEAHNPAVQSNAYSFDVFMLQEEAGASTPTITVAGTPLASFSSQPGAPSTPQNYTVSGSNLTNDIVVTAPADFEVSTTSGGGFVSSLTLPQSGGAAPATPIYVRFNRATAGTSSGNITHTSTGATQKNVAVSGTASTAACTAYTESFDALALGARIGTLTGWTDNGTAGPSVVAGGLASTQGLGTGSSIFNWSAHPFLWTDAGLTAVTFEMDFQANTSGAFDDDRLAWMTENTPGSSQYNFGIQLDSDDDGTACPTGQNIETYWRNPAFSTTRVETTIACLPALTANGWYRARLVVTKLTNTSAKLDVTLTALDAGGAPGAVVASGSVPDTSVWAGGAAPTGYFAPSGSSTGLYPSYKNHTGTTGNADNAAVEICSGPAAQYTLTTNVAGSGSVTRNPDKTTYSSGESVQLTAVPAAGYAFGNWSGDLSGSANPTTIIMNANKTVTANFGPPPTGWIAYNDMNPFTGDANAVNVTKHTYATANGVLVNYNTGAPLPITMSGATVGGYDPDHSTNGGQANAGTDAGTAFGPTGSVIVDMANTLELDDASWDHIITINNLDPTKAYAITLSANRGEPTYDGARFTRVTLQGADLYVNASSSGVVVNSPDSVSFSTGYNTVNGYVARWTGIKSGADGSFSIKSEWDNALGSGTNNTKGYAISALKLEEGQDGQPPNQPTLVAPADASIVQTLSPDLTVQVSDPNSASVSVSFYGREVGAGSGADFTVIALPDTQNYSTSYPATFSAQTQWIVNNRASQNIVYVAHEGDIVNTASSTTEYNNAIAAMALLENPATTGLPEGIPYGVVPGNHDTPTTNYNLTQYFGVGRYCTTYPTGCRGYYGGSYPAGSNDSNYTLFSASGMNFIVINLQYEGAPAGLLDWADALLKANGSRRGIVVSHDILSVAGAFDPWGQQIYDALKDNPNLFLMLCGHNHGESRRSDPGDDGHVIYSVLADYQSYTNGGNGYLRIMQFSPANNEIRFRTYSPTLNAYETDASSEFVLPYNMDGAGPFTLLGTVNGVASGSNASWNWPNLTPGTMYEWYVTVSDGTSTVTGPIWSFTTAALPKAPTGLAIDDGVPTSSDVRITWDAVTLDVKEHPTTIIKYQVYGSQNPYFTPVDPPLGEPTTTSFDHEDVLPTMTNWYYVVAAVNVVGASDSDPVATKRVAKFTFGLTKGTP